MAVPGDADYSGDAVKSPTTLVMEYLAKNKMSPNMPGYGAAVRKALQDNAADPTLIPGLRADRASTEEEDQAAMRGRGGPNVGQSGSAAGAVEAPSNPAQRGNPPSNAAPQERGVPDTDRTTAKTTSAQPDSGYVPTSDADVSRLPLGLAAGGAGGAGSLGAYILGKRLYGSEGTPVPTPVNPTEIHLPRDTIDYTQLDPGRGSAMAEPPLSPMTQALNAATGQEPIPTVGGSVPPPPDLNIGPMPPVRPMGATSPVLPGDLGMPPPQTIPSGPLTQTLPQNMPENAPRVPMPNRVNAPPTPADFYHPSWRTAGPLARAILGHMR